MVLIVVFLLLRFSVAISQDSLSTHPIIRRIKITRNDVFLQTTGKPFIYNWANALHLVTRESVIRRDLLFREGDVYDPELGQESERRLRRLAYLGAATVRATKVGQDSVDVEVITQDQWSTLLQAVIQSGGGRTELGATLEEFNLFGFGKKFLTEVVNEPEGTTVTFNYNDPQLLGSRWTTAAAVVTGPLQDGFSAQLVRPFYSPDTKWAGGTSFSKADFIRREFQGGLESNAFLLENENIQLFLGRAFGKRFNKTRLQLTYGYLNRDFSIIENRTTGELAPDELIHSLSTRISHENLHFVEERRIDRFERTEDITLGNVTSLTLTRTGIPIFKGVRRFEVFVNRSQRHQLSDQQYLFMNFGFQTLSQKDKIATLRLRYYNKSLPWQTLALHGRLDYGWDLEAGRQFLLGGDSGLRGFSAREFSGARRVLFNLEDRIFSNLNILTVALGAVVFMDAGATWAESESFKLSRMRYSAGLGLRLGYTKAPSSRVGRIDLAFPLNGKGDFGVFIGVDQIFSLN